MISESDLVKIEQDARAALDDMEHYFSCPCTYCKPARHCLELIRLIRKVVQPVPLMMAPPRRRLRVVRKKAS
jgi:hypothetical protein